jgi:protein-disulfide isomerase
MNRRFSVFWSIFVLGIFLTGTATAASKKEAPAEEAAAMEKLRSALSAPAQELDAPALKKNMHSRIIKMVQDQGLPLTAAFQAFTPDQITIAKNIPFQVGDRTFYFVSLAFKAPQQIGGNVRGSSNEDQVLVMAVDSTGTYQFENIVEIATSANMLLPAKREVSKIPFPKTFGDLLYEGPGKEDIIFISDPFCPFCRSAWDYLLTKLAKMKSLRLVHRPLPDLHPLAEITSLVMLYAKDVLSGEDFMKLVKYVYGEFYETVPAKQREGWRGSPSEMEEAELNVLRTIFSAFPALNKWGKVEDGYYLIKGKFGRKLQTEQAYLQTLGIGGTPVIYANGYQIRGFNRPELETIFKN